MLKKVLSYILAVGLVFSTMSVVTSFAYIEVDNDDSQGFSNTNNGFDTYLTSSSHYRGDSRRNYNSPDANYVYEFNGHGKSTTTSFKVKMYAYLNDATFNNPKAKYVAYGNSTSFLFGCLNQNTAAGTWNYVGEATVKPLTSVGYNSVTCNSVGVETNGIPEYNTGYNTGADAVRVYF
ncbi:MAG: hypothetical protein K2G36_02860 [Ruminococcus sp.]|nr:hypothetical protein [Ruminococcus sp.]